MDLPDWNEALQQDSFDCSPVKQPLAQMRLKAGNTQRVSARGHPSGAAAAGGVKAAPMLVPVATSAGNENSSVAAAATPAEAPRSVRRIHTPNRTGLTNRAVRLPSRLGATPGAKQPEQFAVPPSTTRAEARAAAAAPLPPTAGIKSILKRLNFSTSKQKAARVAATSAVATSAAAPAFKPGFSAAQLQPESTMKQLRFDGGASVGPAAAPRHVRFDAATASPAPRTRQVVAHSADTPAAASVAFGTPTPAIPEAEEEDEQASRGSGEEESAAAGVGGSVNSARAGSTPFDRRLSSLFRKYQVEGTPELGEEELGGLVDGGAASSPSWKRLSSTSVPEAIRELAKKYDGTSLGTQVAASPTPTPMPDTSVVASTPGHATDVAEGEAVTPVQPAAPDTCSPAMHPTPHDVLAGFLQRNDLYESPAAAAEAAAAAAAAATTAPLLNNRLEQAGGSVPADVRQPHVTALSQQGEEAVALSPVDALARLLAPVLLATLSQIEQERQEGVASGPAGSTGSPAANSSGFLAAVAAAGATPPGASSALPALDDAVQRDSEGIPTVTPPTVTVRRGGHSISAADVPVRDDCELAANLFDSFGGNFSPAERQAQQPQQYQRQLSTVAASAGPEDAAASPEFSFFPTGTPHLQQAFFGNGGVAAEGVTPDLPALAAAGSTTISPEILGFYESQALQQAAAAATDGPSQAAAPVPAMPKSIIKSGRPLNAAGTPVLGHAQRGGPDCAPPTITRELQALMAGLRLEERAEIEQMGTVATLSPVRATGNMRGFLGGMGMGRAITPVRRSTRKMAAGPPRPLEAMLEEADFSYVPNAALMRDDAPPKREEAQTKAAKRAASRATSQASLAAGDGDREQAEPSSTPAAARRYSTRGAAGRAEAQELGTPTPEAQPEEEHRFSLRRLRTLLPHSGRGGAGGPDSPQAVPAADAPVAQDASPQLSESPSFAGTAGTAAHAGFGDGAGGTRRPYSLRASTLKKARRGEAPSTPAAPPPHAATDAAQAAGSGGKQEPPQLNLSPTEQGIRATLRRSSRKSQQGPAR